MAGKEEQRTAGSAGGGGDEGENGGDKHAEANEGRVNEKIAAIVRSLRMMQPGAALQRCFERVETESLIRDEDTFIEGIHAIAAINGHMRSEHLPSP